MLSTPLADLVRQITPKPLVLPPPQFDGTLGELFADFIVPNLPLPSAMTAVHRTLVDYCNLPDSLLLLRYLGGEIRGQMVRTTSGRYRPTDNSPAWLMHFIAFNGIPLPGATHLAGC